MGVLSRTVGSRRFATALVTAAIAWGLGAGDVTPATAAVTVNSQFLDGVACSAANDCVAVGYQNLYDDVRGQWLEPIAVAGDGTHWTPMTLPTAPATLHDVSCAAHVCVAVGQTAERPFRPVALRSTGGAWSATTPVSRGKSATYDQVSCPTATFCIAIGTYTSTNGTVHPYTTRFDGVSWSAVTVPAVSAMLTDVSCSSPQHCLVVGRLPRPNGFTDAFALVWDGALHDLAAATTDPADLRAVDCVSDQACFVLGATYGTTGNATPTFERYGPSGRTSLPAPPAVHPDYRALDCTSVASCRALGSFSPVRLGMSGPIQVLAGFDGTAWTDLPVRLALTSDPSSFAYTPALACWAAQCALVGGGTAPTFYSAVEPSGVPGAPSPVSITSTGSWVNAAWNPPAATGDGPITGYFLNGELFQPGFGGRFVPAPQTRATIDVLSLPTRLPQNVEVHACNATGCAATSVTLSSTRLLTSDPLDVRTTWDSSEVARLQQSAAYLGVTTEQLQHDSVAALAYLTGLAAPAAITPAAIPPVTDNAFDAITTWQPADQSTLRDVARQYALTPSEAQKVATQFVGFLLALGGH